MTQVLAQPTTDPRFACPAPCPECSTHPKHQPTAYLMGVDYGANRYHPLDFDRELAYFDRRIAAAAVDDPLLLPYLHGIYDGLVKQAAAVTS